MILVIWGNFGRFLLIFLLKRIALFVEFKQWPTNGDLNAFLFEFCLLKHCFKRQCNWMVWHMDFDHELAVSSTRTLVIVSSAISALGKESSLSGFLNKRMNAFTEFVPVYRPLIEIA